MEISLVMRNMIDTIEINFGLMVQLMQTVSKKNSATTQMPMMLQLKRICEQKMLIATNKFLMD